MKSWLLTLALAGTAVHLSAQGTYTFQSTASIPITDSVTESTINVQTPCSGNDFVVMNIDADITFEQTGFMKILINDSVLSSYNGGDGADYQNTTFVSLNTPGAQHITAAEPPFNGTYASELNFDLLSAFSINGPWTLKLLVPTELAQGSLNWWGITFGCTGGLPTTVWHVPDGRVACFPNPAANHLHIALPLTGANDVNVMLYNAQGKKVLEQTTAFKQSMTLDVGALTEGLYTVACVVGVNRYTGLVSVQR